MEHVLKISSFKKNFISSSLENIILVDETLTIQTQP